MWSYACSASSRDALRGRPTLSRIGGPFQNQRSVNTSRVGGHLVENINQLCQKLEQEIVGLNSKLSILDAESQTFKIALQSIGDALISTDTGGHIQQMNAAAEIMTGWRQAEAVGQPLANIFRVVSQVTREEVDSLVERLLYDRVVVDWTNHTLLIARDGSERPVANCGAPVRDAKGEITGVVLIFRDQTAELAAQMALKESEARFRDSFEKSTIGKALTAPDGRLIKVNLAFANMLGFSVEQMQQITFSQLTHPDDIAKSMECSRCLLAKERSVCQIEKRYKHRNGHFIVADVSMTLTCNPLGTPLYFITSVTDITQRKLTEQALAASETRYRRLFEAAKDGVLILDADTGKIVDANPFLTELTGYPHEYFLNQHLWEIGLFKDIASSKTEFATLLDRRYVRYEHLPLEAREGRKIDVEFVSNVYFVDGKNVIQCNIRDITARKREEKASRDKEFLLSESQRLGHIGSWLWGMTGPMVWSDELYRLCGASPESFTPTLDSFIHKLHPEDRSATQQWIAACAAAQAPSEMEYRVNLPDGTIRYLRGRCQMVHDAANAQAYMAGTVQDVTSQKEGAVEMEKLEEQLRASQKMEAIGRLAGGVAHDFNNLLSVILIYNEFALDGTADDISLNNDLLEVKMAADRAVKLTQQLLAFSRKQVLQPVPLDLNEITSGLQNMLQRVLGEDIDLVCILAPDLGLTLADSGQIEQVLMNLVVNARDAMPEGGKLTIETANVDIDEHFPMCNITTAPGSYVQLVVTDTGHGMDAQTRARIFEPFFTTKDETHGTGLGLSTVHGIVKQSGGNIWVYSEPGTGTSFKIYLPRELSTSTATTVRPMPFHARVTGAETILLVEDDESLRKAARRTLEAAGYKVLVAENGAGALLTSAQRTGDVHLLLTDVVMPHMSGRALANELLKARPTLKVLYTSGYTDNTIDQHGVLPAGTNFIGKPFTTAALTRKVRQALDDA
jgi:two-component system, cell cycle sensor histidine kinase and response regulator CckA